MDNMVTSCQKFIGREMKKLIIFFLLKKSLMDSNAYKIGYFDNDTFAFSYLKFTLMFAVYLKI